MGTSAPPNLLHLWVWFLGGTWIVLLWSKMKWKQQTMLVAWPLCSKRQDDTSGSIIAVDKKNNDDEWLNIATTMPTFIAKARNSLLTMNNWLAPAIFFMLCFPCHYCQNKGHLQSVRISKRKQDTGVRYLWQLDTLKTVRRSIPPLCHQVKLDGHKINFKHYSGAINAPGSRLWNWNLVQWRASKLQMGTYCKYWESSKSPLKWLAKLEV